MDTALYREAGMSQCGRRTRRRRGGHTIAIGDGQRTVLTTGANSGIGLATTIELARRGFRSVGSVRSAAKARTVRSAARDAGVEVDTVLLDVTDPRACARVVNRLRPHAVVNNAGYSVFGAVEDVGDDEARAVLETMVLAPMRLARLALPHMREAGGGRIVNLSSIYGLTTTPLTGWYQACKHAIEALSDALRIEVARDGVKVILVEPGGFDTGIWEDTQRQADKRADSRYRSAYQRSLAGVRLTRPVMGDPGVVARAIAAAVASRRPRTRYLVGYDAQAIRAYHLVVPERVRDRLARLTLDL
jgi:NAD(P)-dependent dehydrogenase (short-subunit alcohol dehydrogenase family)